MSDDSSDLRGLAAVINQRLAAQARIARATAFGWVCAGGAIAFVLVGMGAALALIGYSSTLSVRPAAEDMASSLARAFSDAEIKTKVSGQMTLAPDSLVKLAPNQTVKFQEGTIVKLDPDSSVRVVGDLKIDVPQPSKQQLQLDATTGENELPITNYTIFRSVQFGNGQVVTGWNYDLADTARPRFQYCYYSENIERGLAAKYTIAVNSSAKRPSSLAKLSFNFDGAVPNCIWFSGS